MSNLNNRGTKFIMGPRRKGTYKRKMFNRGKMGVPKKRQRRKIRKKVITTYWKKKIKTLQKRTNAENGPNNEKKKGRECEGEKKKDGVFSINI